MFVQSKPAEESMNRTCLTDLIAVSSVGPKVVLATSRRGEEAELASTQWIWLSAVSMCFSCESSLKKNDRVLCDDDNDDDDDDNDDDDDLTAETLL